MVQDPGQLSAPISSPAGWTAGFQAEWQSPLPSHDPSGTLWKSLPPAAGAHRQVAGTPPSPCPHNRNVREATSWGTRTHTSLLPWAFSLTYLRTGHPECDLVKPLWRTVWKLLKKLKRVAIWSSNPTPGHRSRQNYNSRRYMHPSVHSSNIYNSQDVEAA